MMYTCTIIALVLTLLTGCESSRDAGAAAMAMPLCVLICVVRQDIVTDNNSEVPSQDTNVTYAGIPEPQALK